MKVIVIEGIDGCGKETQSKLLYKYLKGRGLNVLLQSFPNYRNKSSALVKMFLNEEFGTGINELNYYQSSLLFTVDRLVTFKTDLRNLPEDTILILDRYVQSNLLYELPLINNEKEREDYKEWLYDLEYSKLGLPKPDIVLYLDVPADISIKLREKRNTNKSEQEKDIYESNNRYLEKVYNIGKELIKEEHWTVINCINNSELKSINEINKDIINKVLNVLKLS